MLGLGSRGLGSVTISTEMAPARSPPLPPCLLHSSMRATERPSVYTYTYTHTATSAWSTEAPSCLTHCWAAGPSLLSASHLQRLGLIHMTAKWSWERRIELTRITGSQMSGFCFLQRVCVFECVCVRVEGALQCNRFGSICSAKLIHAPRKWWLFNLRFHAAQGFFIFLSQINAAKFRSVLPHFSVQADVKKHRRLFVFFCCLGVNCFALLQS